MTLTIRQRISRVGRLCCTVTRNLAYRRTSHDTIIKKGNFWVTADGNFLDICVLDFCKLFADNNGKHHWKKVVPDAEHENFITGLLSHLNFDQDEFDEYLDVMKTYRNKFVAHLDDKRVMNIPTLDFARDSTAYLYDYLKSLHPEWFPEDAPESMTDYYNECEGQAQEAIDHLR